MTKEYIGILMGIVALGGGMLIAVLAVINGIKAGNEQKMAQIESRARERLALIEKGMDPLLADKKNPLTSIYNALLWGFLLTGVGLGIFIGYVLAKANGWDLEVMKNALAAVFGGIGLLCYYVFRLRQQDKQSI